jgi:hypothetical protein
MHVLKSRDDRHGPHSHLMITNISLSSSNFYDDLELYS